MHIEFRHLRTIRAIHEEGGLARAAEYTWAECARTTRTAYEAVLA